MTSRRKQWRKNLYENVDYADNYTDASFLQELRTNINVQILTYRDAAFGITRLNNQISCITGFLMVFHALNTQAASPAAVLWPSVIFTGIGYSILRRWRIMRMRHFVDDSKTICIVLLFGYIFAPLLHTLTGAISTDTIFSVTFLVMVLNVAFHDYGLSVAMVSNALSLNAAVFGAICLASRLPTSYHAFVLLVEAAIFFVLYPKFVASYWQWYYMVVIFIVCCFTLFRISRALLVLYATGSLFINFVCPWLFILHQRYKHNIHGPWDEAIVEENTDAVIDDRS